MRRDPRCLLLMILILGAPGLLCSPFAQYIPVPLRLLLGFLWITVPIGEFLMGRLEDVSLPSPARWSVACLLGWCAACFITLVTIVLGGSWLILGCLIGLCSLIGALWPKRSILMPGQVKDKNVPAGLSLLLAVLTALSLAYVLRMGGFMAQDGSYHLAYLLDVLDRDGPGPAHPFLDSTEFDPRYPLSSYHCLLSFLSVLCHLPHVDVWFYLPGLWLLPAIGGWCLFGTRVFQSRSCGEMCAIFFVLLALMGITERSLGFHELRTLVYPGGFSLHILLPALIAWSWNLSTRRPWSILPVALIALTLATTQLFYFVLSLLVLSSGLVGLTLLARRGGRLKAVAISTVVTVLVASPILLWAWSRYEGVVNPVFLFDPHSKAPHDYLTHLLRTGGGTFILHPKTWLKLIGLNAYATNAPFLALVCLMAFWTRIDREIRAFLAGAVCILISLMSIPPLFVWVTQTMTLYKSFRLFQALPVIPLLAIGAHGASEWVVLLRRKALGNRSVGASISWVPVFVCLALFWIAVPDCISRAGLLQRGWDSVHSWWREPRRDLDQLRFQAMHEVAAKDYAGAVLADPFDALAYGGLFGGKVLAIPDFHAAPTSRDIRERINTVDAIRSGWLSSEELRESLDRHQIGVAFFQWSQLSPLGQATLSACLERETIVPPRRPRHPRSQGQPLQSEDDYRRAYTVFHSTADTSTHPGSVFVDLEIKDNNPYRLGRDGTIRGPAGVIVASVTPFVNGDPAERFKYWKDQWIVATRSGRLVTLNGEEISLHTWRQAPGKKRERPTAVLLSQDRESLLVLGSRGSWWATNPPKPGHFSQVPVWRTEVLRGACRDPRGGILLLSAFGGVHSLGEALPMPQERPNWGNGGGSVDMATDLALDPSGTCLYLLTRVGEIYRLARGTPVEKYRVSDRPDSSVWLSLAVREDCLVAMDWQGRVSRIPLPTAER